MSMQTELQNRNSSDRWISFAVCFQVFLLGVKNMLVQAFPYLFEINDTLNTVLFVVVGVLYVLAYCSLGGRMLSFTPTSLLVMTFWVLSFALSSMIHPETVPYYMEWLFRSVTFCFLTCFIITRLSTLEWIIHYMQMFAYVIVGVGLVTTLTILSIGHTTSSDWSTYSMSFSYVVMVSVMWLFHVYFKNHRLFVLLIAGIGVLCILLCGSRNPLLAIAVYVVIKIIGKVFSRKSSVRERWIYLIWMTLILLFFVLWTPMIQLVGRIISALGIYSRTVGLFMENALFDSGRLTIHENIRKGLNQSPFLGLGIGGEYLVADDTAHSLYWSIFASFGYVLGGLLLIFLAVLLIYAYRKANDRMREVLLLYMCMVFPRSFTGVEFWVTDIFWWMIGIVGVIFNASRSTRAADLHSHRPLGEEALSGGAVC